MAEPILAQIEKLHLSIHGLEAQREILGDAIVNPALAALQKQLAELEEQAAAQAAPAEERRMVTILFIDMVGSTSIAEKLDPEEWRQIVSSVHATLGGIIANHHGSVAQYLGDGLLAFFGAKGASEQDPENAIRAALDAQAAIANLPFTEKIQIRAGMHTGLVVVGELGDTIHKEFTASGDAMNLAARLQAAAPAGGTLISHDTYRYVRGVFDMTLRPPITVKGKSEPIQTYLVRKAKPRPFRIVARGVAGVETRTVGREAEIDTLQKAYLRAYERKRTVWAQLLGEPGMGKSRLLLDLMDWLDLRDENFRLMRGRAFPDDVNQPFVLIRRMWFDRFQIAEDAPLEIAEAKWVEHFKELYGQDKNEEAAHALGLLVGLPFQNSPYIKAMRNDPTQVKGRALVVSRDLVRTIRQRSPVVVLLEDLQWADHASWEYLSEVFLDEAKLPNGLFVLGSSRPECHFPEAIEKLFISSAEKQELDGSWGIQIYLGPLSDVATRELANELLQRTKNVPGEVIELLVERSEGVPYFTEELINWFIDHDILDTQGDEWQFYPEKLRTQPLPASLQHLLLTRLSSLSQPERAVLQRGAIFGRRFWTGGIEALGVTSSEKTLAHLQPRGFVDAQPESAFEGDMEWSFHHNLLHEVTYESVLKRERATLHKVAAGWLEEQARQAGRLEEFAGLLGEHYKRANELSTAVDWYLLAGRRAIKQGAPHEAATYYTQALELLPPVDQERRWQALIGRDDALIVSSDVEAERLDIAALLELARSFGDDHHLAEAYLRQALFNIRAGEMSGVDQAIKEAFTAAERCGNEAIQAKARIIVAQRCVIQGDVSAGIENAEAAIQLARRLGDGEVLSFVLLRAAFCYAESGDISRAYPLQHEQIELAHRLGDRNAEAIGLGNLGSRLILLGQYKQARVTIEQARKIDEELGAHRALAYNLMRLANIYMLTGDLRKAHQMIEQTLVELALINDARGKTLTLIEHGIILLKMSDAPGAIRRLSEAHQIAIDQGIVAERCMSAACLAAATLMQGELDQAREHADEAWTQLRQIGAVGIYWPGLVYRLCYETYEALGELEIAHQVLEAGHQELMVMASRIDIPDGRKSFLENVQDNRALIELWERSKH